MKRKAEIYNQGLLKLPKTMRSYGRGKKQILHYHLWKEPTLLPPLSNKILVDLSYEGSYLQFIHNPIVDV